MMDLRYARRMDRVALVRAELDERVRVARIAEAAPACRECRYDLGGGCGNPALTKTDYQPHTGYFGELVTVSLSDARSDKGLCGPEALLFDPLAPSEMQRREWREALSDGFGYAFLAAIILIMLTT